MLAEGAARAGTLLRIVERRWFRPDFLHEPGFPDGSYLEFAVSVKG